MDRVGLDQPRCLRGVLRHHDRFRLVRCDQRHIPFIRPLDTVMGAERIHARLRRARHPCRPSRRPQRPPQDVHDRCRRVHHRLDALRSGPERRLPDGAAMLEAIGTAILVLSSLALVLQIFSARENPFYINLPVGLVSFFPGRRVLGDAKPTRAGSPIRSAWRFWPAESPSSPMQSCRPIRRAGPAPISQSRCSWQQSCSVLSSTDATPSRTR